MNFYQSSVRTYINKDIYQKPTFQVELLGKQYFGITKIQRKLGKEFRWYMIHGVEIGDTTYFNEQLQRDLYALGRDFNHGFGDMFFQLGLIDQFDERLTEAIKSPDIQSELKQKRLYLQSDLWQRYNLKPSWREHMPDATIQIDLQQPLTELKKGLSSSGKRYLNKGKKAELTFEKAATEQQRQQFWECWYATGYDKGFAIPTQDKFFALMNYLTETDQGALFLAYQGKELVSGSVCVFYEKELIYLYGATDRAFGAIGGHYWLTYQIAKRGHKQHFEQFDLLGVATPGFEDGHYLRGVTRFKQAFGGKTISSLGNYDLVFNKLLYNAYKRRKKK